MRLLYYELYKIGTKKLLIGFIPILLIMNISLYTYTEWQQNGSLIRNMHHYQLVESTYQSLPIQEGYRTASSKMQELELFNLFASEAVIATHNPEWKKEIEAKKQQQPEAVTAYLSSPYVNNNNLLKRDLLLYSKIAQQYKAIIDYRSRMLEMQQRAADMLSVTIFQDNASSRNIHKTLKDFAPLQQLPLQIGLEEGIVSSTSFTPLDVTVVVLLFLITIYIFHREREAGLLPLLHTTRRGRLDTAAVKLGILTFVTLLLSLLFYGSILLVANYLYEFGDWNRYIQSMTSFQGAVQPLTVLEYLLQYLILKSFACLLIAIMMALLFIGSQRPTPVYVTLLAMLGISFICYTQIHPNSYVNSLKYLNPVAFLDTFNFISDYRNIYWFGYPASKATLSYITGGSFIVIGTLGALWLYTLQRSIGIYLPWSNVWQNIRIWTFRIRRSNSLFLHECYKLMITGRAWIILGIGLFLTLQMIQTEARTYNLEEAIYNQYLMKLQGPLTSDKKVFMEAERQRFNQLGNEQAEWEQRYIKGEITRSTYQDKQLEWKIFLDKEKSFRLVEKQYQYLLAIQAQTGHTASFVNKLTSDQLFDRPSRDIVQGILYLSLLCALVSPIFTQDYHNNSVFLLRATLHGRSRLFTYKLAIALCLSLVLLAMTYSPMYINLTRHYPAIDWTASIQSVEQFETLPWNLSIINYVCLVNVLQALGCMLLIPVIQLLSIFVRKQALSLMLLTAILISPLALAYIGFKQLASVTFNGLFLLTSFLRDESATMMAATYFGSLLVISAGAAVFGWRKYNGQFTRKE
ncbi:hypothetical protein ABN764_09640 [Paenibacillaceae sp. P-4]|uniref:hypothetical protein n=1 Tax=Paenibacillaceae bacterium P-4 TaxID=3160969 RepID=UPI0032E80451